MIRIGVIGGLGKMGQETINAVSKEPNFEVCALLDVNKVNEKVVIGYKEFTVSGSIDDVKDKVDIFIDFTGPSSVKLNAEKIISLGKNLIIGATGLLKDDVENIRTLTEKSSVNVMIIPNFAIGAVLMMEFAKKAAAYMNEVEIIEYHHPGKLDAPSGTSIKTAELIKAVKEARPEMKGTELIEGARGAEIGDINIHSVRLNGYVASQEVIFGGLGQILTIRHDSINRESFMPGVILALNKISNIRGFIYGLENIL